MHCPPPLLDYHSEVICQVSPTCTFIFLATVAEVQQTIGFWIALESETARLGRAPGE
jgi:hypothetical protein